MAGSKVSNFAIGDSNIQSVMLTLDKTFKGQHQVSLTNYDTTAESQVAAGSVIEIGGALYKFDSNESITGSPSDGTVYIMAVPSGDSVTCAYTNTAPTWSDSKQGWYGTGATANNRYLEFVIVKSSVIWQKYIMASAKNGESYLKSFVMAGGSAPINSVASNIKTVDILSEYNNSDYSFVPKKSGYYLIIGNANSTASDFGALAVRINQDGSSYYNFGSAESSAGYVPHFNFSGIVFLEQGRAYTMYIFSNDIASACVTRIAYYKIGDLF